MGAIFYLGYLAMYKYLSKLTVLLLAFSSAHDVNANQIYHKFSPTTTIDISKNSGGVEISTRNLNFTTSYLKDKKVLEDINIPFTVKSSTDENISYNLKLIKSNHMCSLKKENNETFTVDLQLDGEGFSSGKSVKVFPAVHEREHRLNISFPEEIEQMDQEQTCSGTVTIEAEIIL